MHPAKPVLLRRIRLWLALFMAGLVLSGATAFPLVHELRLLDGWMGASTALGRMLPDLGAWITQVRLALEENAWKYPFLAYGYDWLAFEGAAVRDQAVADLGTRQARAGGEEQGRGAGRVGGRVVPGVLAVVAGRDGIDHAGGQGTFHGGVYGGPEARPGPEAHVRDHGDARVRELLPRHLVDAGHDAAGAAGAVRAEHLDAVEGGAGSNARHVFGVVPARRDAGAARAVAVLVLAPGQGLREGVDDEGNAIS